MKTNSQQRKRGSMRERASYCVDLINGFLKKMDLETAYLEIGCDTDATFSQIRAKVKVGVDPEAGGTVRATSDKFFAANQQRFDVVFIDGLHQREQVLRDVDNSLANLNPGGLILLHDCLPTHRESQLRDRVTQAWHGDVWRAVLDLRQRWDIDVAVVEADEGIGIVVPRRNTARLRLDRDPDFEEMSSDLMRTICDDEIENFLDLPAPTGHLSGKTWFRHTLFTRFNLGQTDPGWLLHRFRYFERFTLPSVREQTSQRFEWVIEADAATPEPFRSQLESVTSGGTAEIVWVSADRTRCGILPETLKYIVETGGDETHLGMSRLDSGDSIMRDYVAMVQRAVIPGRAPEFLSFPCGLQWSEGTTRSYTCPRNPFRTCIEPASNKPRLLPHVNHNETDQSCKVREIEPHRPMWQRTIHDRSQK